MLSTLPAQAQTRVSCGVINGMDYCLTDTLEEDIVLIIGPKGGERITIDCNSGAWRSKGPNTQEFVQTTVNTYCNNSI